MNAWLALAWCGFLPPVPTYHAQIAPLLHRKCAACHRPGEAAPFSILGYRNAAAWAEAGLEAIEEGLMPPWHASPEYGRFSNDPRLTAEELALLRAWVVAEKPEGDPTLAPPLPPFPEGWQISPPHRVYTMPTPFSLPPSGVLDYQFIEIDPGFTEDQWIQAGEFRPGNRRVVHHCNVVVYGPGEPAEGSRLASVCLLAFAPGTPPLRLPAGKAKRVAAGSKLVFVMHYTTTGKPETDQSSLGLVFADPTTIRQEVITRNALNIDFAIPPGAPAHRVIQVDPIPEAIQLLSLFPHMHLRGKSFRYEALYPDGRQEILLDVPRYDFNWQNVYHLAEPKVLPAGSQLRCTALYDNSTANPANPDPSATVRPGMQSWDEMFNGYYDVVLLDQDLQHWRSRLERWWTRWQRWLLQPLPVLGMVTIAGFLLIRRWVARARKAG